MKKDWALPFILLKLWALIRLLKGIRMKLSGLLLALIFTTTSLAVEFKGKSYVPLDVKAGTWEVEIEMPMAGGMKIKQKVCYTEEDLKLPSMGMDPKQADKNCEYTIKESTKKKFVMAGVCGGEGKKQNFEVSVKASSPTTTMTKVSGINFGNDQGGADQSIDSLSRWLNEDCPESLRVKNMGNNPEADQARQAQIQEQMQRKIFEKMQGQKGGSKMKFEDYKKMMDKYKKKGQ